MTHLYHVSGHAICTYDNLHVLHGSCESEVLAHYWRHVVPSMRVDLSQMSLWLEHWMFQLSVQLARLGWYVEAYLLETVKASLGELIREVFKLVLQRITAVEYRV